MECMELEYAGEAAETSVIENCYNTGNIKITNDLNIPLTKFYLSIGAGIVGMNYGKILSCYNTGDITQNGYRSYNGGVVGRSIGGDIEKCYTSGNILASATYILPGPTILSTLGIDSVPYASAAIACAPPTL